ncbi:uncharacterized protein [Nicotiana tomentosiformis]|uniref:uncharacterized protein n=1 Tax=Nicotiana tomentosiformis TaxID=4098 RepID=UPI00388C6A83
MRIVILSRNKLGFIDDTCKKENYGTNLVDLWECCNAIVLSWLMNCVSPKLLSGMVYSSNASAIWDDLKERFDKVDCSRSFQIHKEIAFASQGTSLISTYFSKLRAQSQLLMMVPVPSVNKAYSMLMECESEKTMANASANLDAGEMAALLTNRVGNQPKKNYNLYCNYCKLKRSY